jgi:signal transduction histidine kinase
MNARRRQGRGLGLAGIIMLSAAGLSFLLSYLLPAVLTSDYEQKSLARLQRQSHSLQREFANLLKDQNQKMRRAAGQAWPRTTELQFRLLKSLGLNPATEGIAVYTEAGNLVLWLGNVLNLEEAVPGGISDAAIQRFGQTLLIENKASSYLVSLHWVDPQTLLVLTRLLAFIPRFRSPFVSDYHFLRPGLRRNAEIDYYDFREETGGFETFFSRHEEGYVGQPRLQNDILSLFFPLRNERNQILATVTLRSPSRAASTSAVQQALLVGAYALLAAALIVLLILLVRRPSFLKLGRPAEILGALGLLATFRLILFPLSRLSAVQSLSLFAPTLAGFFSVGRLTASPADIIFTAFVLFVIGLGASKFIRRKRRVRTGRSSAVVLGLVLIASVGLYRLIQEFGTRLASNAGLNLVDFRLTGGFLLLHLSLALFSAGGLLVVLALLRTIAPAPSPLPAGLLFLAVEIAAYSIDGYRAPAVLLSQAFALGVLLIWALYPPHPSLGRRSVAWVAILVQVLFVYAIVRQATEAKSRTLVEGFLKTTILSQEDWARFYLAESCREIDNRRAVLLAFLRNPTRLPDPARTLWDKTPAARVNWYSAFEILDAKGGALARFSLNVPALFRTDAVAAPGSLWTVTRLSIPFIGKKKEFLVASKAWEENGRLLGRAVFSMSLDDAMLPFLYSANPYYELLRVNSLPSLNQFGVRMAVYGSSGEILFNPYKIANGLPPSLLEALRFERAESWTDFTDKGVRFRLFAFRAGDRIYALFTPRADFLRTVIDYFKWLCLDGVFILLPALILVLVDARRRGRHPLWSFGTRVYISFVAVAIVPLILFAFFSRSFFSRVFTQQFVEKAEALAGTARSVMDDYIYYQRQDRPDIEAPPEDLMLWISTTIANDVNLYREGRLVSSSRSEFFDAGLFPDLLDGEIYYRIQFENNPFYAQKQSIGKFSFQTLTIPYITLGPRLMISLPFPFQEEEVAAATQALFEFVLFLSVFFVLTVLFLARGIGSMIVTPIQKLLDGTREASLGNLDFSIEYSRQDEMKTLVDGFNTMIQNLKDHERELADLGKKAAWAEMARKVAHEIKNPLTPIQLSAEHLLRVYEDGRGDFELALRESLSYIVGEVENLRRIAQEFLETSKEAIAHRETFDFAEFVRETLGPYERLLEQRIAFRLECTGADFQYLGDRAKLKVALRNLLTNAIESIRGKGEIRVRLAEAEGRLTLEVEDTGEGIEKELLARIFEPYFSTKDVGTGLGLPITKNIVEDHGGTIEITSEPGRGTKVTLRFRRSAG